MKKTTKLHTYAVLWLDQQKYRIEEIANEIGLSIVQVTNILKKHNKKLAENAQSQSNDTIKPNTKNLMITDSTAKKYKVAIMTKDASMANDDLKKQINKTPKTQSYIYRPNDGQ